MEKSPRRTRIKATSASAGPSAEALLREERDARDATEWLARAYDLATRQD